MDNQFYIENLQNCNGNGINDCTDLSISLGDCLCNLLKVFCVTVSVLFFIAVIVVAIILLIWLLRLFSLWLNPKFYNHPQLLAPRDRLCYGRPFGRCLPTGERTKSKATDSLSNEAIVYNVGAYLKIMNLAMTIICDSNKNQLERIREMSRYQTMLSRLKRYKEDIECLCNSKIYDLTNQLSDCLDKMPDCIAKNGDEKKQIEDAFKKAKEGLEALLKTVKK